MKSITDDAHRAYWRQQLADLPALELPADRPRPATRSDRGARLALPLPAAFYPALQARCREELVSEFVLLLAVFKLLLFRSTAQADLAVSTRLAQRDLVVRSRIRPGWSFRQLLQHEHILVLEAQRHQDVSPEQLAEAHDLPLQVAFALYHEQAEQQPAIETTTRYDLALAVRLDPHQLLLELEYATDLFEAPTIARMLAQYRQLLEQVLQQPEQPIAHIPLLSPDEQQLILRTWNATHSETNHDQCWHAMIEDQAERTPDALAIVFDPADRAQAAEALSYRALDQRANQLAHALRALGVGPEVLVGICLERSLDLVIAALAVLKAGGAFVPLDPAYPPERIAFMLADTAAPVILTHARLAPRLQNHAGRIMCLDTARARIEQQPTRPLDSGVTLENLAYVIYTSGSTGTPKGVQVAHRGINNVSREQQRFFGLSPEDRVAQWASFNFDASVFDIVMALCTGATLYLGPQEAMQPGPRMVELLRTHAITNLTITPSALAVLPEAEVTSVRTLLVAGEACSADLVARWAPGRRFFNGYGPTETTIWASAAECRPSEHKPSIGGPIENVQLYVLDAALEPVPIGVAGELHIGSIGLARGYLGRPELTAERFIPNPFAENKEQRTKNKACPEQGRREPRTENQEPRTGGQQKRGAHSPAHPFTCSPVQGDRLYKTGDRVRWLPDGTLDFLGRLDDQVKVRGFRIELGEIEAVLASHPALADACVVLHEASSGDKRLVAYVVPTTGSPDKVTRRQADKVTESEDAITVSPLHPVTVSGPELRAFLKKRLPDYMVPSAFVLLERLPLTTNGKVDRRALPAPKYDWAQAGAYAAPRTATEAVLAELWAGALTCERVGIHDHFLALGGHSLLAIQLLTQVGRLFRVPLPGHSIFDAPTVAEQALLLAVHEPAAGQVDQIAQLLVELKDRPEQEIRHFLPALSQSDTSKAADIMTIARLAMNQEQLWADLLQTAGLGTGLPQQIARCERAGGLPLSFAQQRLLVLDTLLPRSPLHTVTGCWQLHGPLDSAALAASLQALVQRHEILRTTFVVTDDQAIQQVHPTLTLPLPIVELPAGVLPQHWIAAQIQQPFDIARLPLLRCTLLRRSATEHWLVLLAHHIIFDAWSAALFAHELQLGYAAERTAEARAALPIQYADYAHWQRNGGQDAALAAQQTYWQQQLADLPALELPADRPRPATRSDRGARQVLHLPAAFYPALQARCREELVSEFVLLLAVFKLLLHRSTAQADLAVGTPVAHRQPAAVTELIGCFVNMLVVRSRIRRDWSFRQLLQHEHTLMLEGQRHQDVPFQHLVDTLIGSRARSLNPLFQVAFVLYHGQAEQELAPDLRMIWDATPIETTTARYDLTLAVRLDPHQLLLELEYSTDLFEAPTIARMLAQYRQLLEHVLQQPEQPIAHIPLLTADEQQLILRTWNATQSTPLAGGCIHELVAAQARRQPDAPAVVFSATQDGATATALTYHMLDQRANQLAHELRSLGVGPEVLVGICLERSLDLVIAALAVLKAGGAFVPIDPAYPPERIAFMLADTAAPVILTHNYLVERLPDAAGRVICLDDQWIVAAPPCAEPLNSGVALDNLAYVIYTSGSTGTPKGVAVSHRGLLNLAGWHQRTFAVTDCDRATLLAGVGFDAAVWELWPYLAAGAAVYIPDQVIRADPQLLRDWLVAHTITISFVPTPLAEVLLRLPWPQNTPLHSLLTGGDKLHLPPPAGLPFTLINNYGPTENSVVTTSGTVAPATPGAPPLLPSIGRPIANTQVYVLDAALEPVPIGVAGELYIGSIGLARGYLNRPALTAEKFIPNPFALNDKVTRRQADKVIEAAEEVTLSPLHPVTVSGPEVVGDRLYKTGDRVRWLPDGTLDFLGRLDDQVKVRGFRIELGEIEAVLASHPALADACVVLHEAAPGDRRLVAYVVPTTGSPDKVTRRQADKVTESEDAITVSPLHPVTVSGPELRAFLKKRLPDYMVPSAFVLLERLPLTANGKVDRRALPAPEDSLIGSADAPEEPRSPIEATLSKIWSDILGVEHVGIHDNFFELGGDSILAIQVVARAKHAGLNIGTRHLIECQTIADLAAAAATLTTVVAEQGLVTGAVPLTPIQHWFFEQGLADPHYFNQALLIDVEQPLDPAHFDRAIAHLLAHHDALRLRFTQNQAGWQQVIDTTIVAPPCRVVDVAGEPDPDRVISAISAEVQAQLNLTAGPLVRSVLFDFGAGRPQCLLIAVHHLAVDGVSWRILLDDLEVAYHALVAGETPRLPAKTTSFKQWAERVVAYAQTEEVQRERAYWLADSRRSVAALPVDRTGMPNTVATTQTASLAFDPATTHALLHELTRNYHAQSHEVLLTVLAWSLARWTGTPTCLIDVEGHGREPISEEIDVTRTVGWFTTICPMLLDLAGTSQISEAVRLVKEQMRLVPNKGMHYGMLRYLGGEAEDLAGLPQAEISFNYLGQLDQILAGSTLFGSVPAFSPAYRSPHGLRKHLLEVNGYIAGDQLCLEWTYNEQIHDQATIERLAHSYQETLHELLADCRSTDADATFTPTDFPLLQFNQEELDLAFALVTREEEYA